MSTKSKIVMAFVTAAATGFSALLFLSFMFGWGFHETNIGFKIDHDLVDKLDKMGFDEQYRNSLLDKGSYLNMAYCAVLNFPIFVYSPAIIAAAITYLVNNKAKSFTKTAISTILIIVVMGYSFHTWMYNITQLL